MDFATFDPTDNRKLSEYSYHTAEQLEAVLSDLPIAQQHWAALRPDERKKALSEVSARLRHNSEALALLMANEMGKPIRQGRAEVEKCASAIGIIADLGCAVLQTKTIEAHYASVKLEPMAYGIVLSIQPWNFPLWQVLRMASGAWMAGNLVLLKHSEISAGIGNFLEKICDLNGLNLLKNIRVPNEVTASLIRDDRIAMVTLTGSTRAGKQVGAIAGECIKKQVLELGGSDAYVVTEEAEIHGAAKICATSRLVNSGQSCISAKRFFIHDAVYEDFIRNFKSDLAAAAVGSPLDEAVEVGPLAAKRFVNELRQQIERAIAEGGKYEVIQNSSSLGGNFVDIGIIEFGANLKAFSDVEVFAPVALVYRYNQVEEVLNVINSGPYGLGGAVFSKNIARAEEIARKMQVGSVVINSFLQSDARVPFGGIKNSGLGREMGELGLFEFVRWQVIARN